MFDCPRCGAKDIDTAYYGPCPECRVALNAAMYREPTDVGAAAAYVPKMNVTPNAVALKEDN
jgi:hypothetical protein